jgi:hypothetical protein
MVERDAFERNVAGFEVSDETVQIDRVGNLGDERPRNEIRHDHDFLQRRQLARNLLDAGQSVVRFAAVLVTVDAEQYFGLDLTEAVQHPLHTEVGRAR